MKLSDSDKPHRCPTCWTIPDRLWEGNKLRVGHRYTCRNGHTFVHLGHPSNWLHRMRRRLERRLGL